MHSPKAVEFRADSLLTSYQVGALLQVNPSSVNKWVKDGRITAFRTPGGHRRIRAGDLVAFLHEHKMPTPSSLAQAARRRLLVADHELESLQQLQQLLAGHADRIELSTASNGVEALVHVGSFRPHLVLLDAHMPALDGLEVCRQLRASHDTERVAVVLTSATPSEALATAATAAGARRLLHKPYALDAIFAELGLPAPGAAV